MEITNKDVVWGYLAQFFSIASGLLVLPLVLRYLTPNEIGMNYLMLTIGSMVALFDFGFAPQFARNLTYIFSGAQTLKKEGLDFNTNHTELKINYRLLATMIYVAKYVYSILAFIVLFLMLSLGSIYIFYTTKGANFVNNALTIWLIYSLSTFFNVYYTYYTSLLEGKGMIKETKKAMIYSKLVYILLTIIFIFCNLGLISLALSNLIAPFVSRWLSYKYFFTTTLKSNINSFTISKQEKLELFKIVWHNSKKLGLVYLGSYAINKFSMFLAGLYLPLQSIASYGLLIQLVSVLSTISGTIFVISNPRLSFLKLQSKKSILLKEFSFTLITFYLLFFVGGVFLLFAPFFLTLIKSNTTLPSTTIIFIYLIVVFLENNHSFFSTMIVMGNTVPFLKIALYTGFLIALGSYLSLSLTNFEILGLVIVQGVVQLAYNNWKWPLYFLNDFKINFFTFLKLGVNELQLKILR